MVPAVSPGEPFPLGATFDGLGTNFSVFSQAAEAVELCLFDDGGTETRYQLPEVDAYCWHGHLEGVEPGCRYGYRVHGPYDPETGPALQPGQAAPRPLRQGGRRRGHVGPAAYAYDRRADDLRIDTSDSAASMPKAIVVDPAFDWGADRPPRTRWADTVIYETHVKGLTWTHPGHPGPPAGHLRGRGPPGHDRAFHQARGSPPSSSCRSTTSSTTTAWSSWGCATTGATTPSPTWPPTTATRPGAGTGWSTSSRPWSGPCTPPASR